MHSGPYLSSQVLHIIVSLLYVRTGTSNDSCCRLLALTRDLIAPATFLPLATFLLHSASSIPDSSKTHPNYLNSERCSKRIPSTQTSHSNVSSPPNTKNLDLTCIDFHTSYPTHLSKASHHRPQVSLRLTTQNQVICLQEARQSPLSSLFPIPIFICFISASLCTL